MRAEEAKVCKESFLFVYFVLFLTMDQEVDMVGEIHFWRSGKEKKAPTLQLENTISH